MLLSELQIAVNEVIEQLAESLSFIEHNKARLQPETYAQLAPLLRQRQQNLARLTLYAREHLRTRPRAPDLEREDLETLVSHLKALFGSPQQAVLQEFYTYQNNINQALVVLNQELTSEIRSQNIELMQMLQHLETEKTQMQAFLAGTLASCETLN
ncbi:hypothetical protein SAMN05421831_10234 [Allopseudospirillum japonicum]|uniref:Uncharacterized protein n=1 Tax=Allopseudospirillum japonicum TaxID=64971 RepID=A0A1H6QV91_9GAMM|nr:hypothetical protein [Allopseudospirillum japonicum]SEI44854.1 hypothetical protein SAMN05421831_10234 [Allopseudospirillum japonicum]